jgi:hypothetical protein
MHFGHARSAGRRLGKAEVALTTSPIPTLLEENTVSHDEYQTSSRSE